jgi:HAD superfamily hydrolase (TIGR01509 family)
VEHDGHRRGSRDGRRVRALLFDFDGTLWDSERASFEAWRETYAEHGQEYSLDRFAGILGTLHGGDPLAELERLVGPSFDRVAVGERRRRRKMARLDGARPLPGVTDYLTEARTRGLRLAIVSTDDLAWISAGLRHLGLAEWWDFIECAEGDLSRAKPSPALYLAALERLSMGPYEAIAIEDSPNGIAAAKAAGLFCLAVANAVTEQLDLGAADLVVRSLSELPLAELLAHAEGAPATD